MGIVWFGFGMRLCPGQHFARVQLSSFLTNFVALMRVQLTGAPAALRWV
jgi:cytochrome P450